MNQSRRTLALLTFALLSMLGSFFVPPVQSHLQDQDDELTLAEGTPLNIVCTQQISGKTAGPGTNLNFKVVDDVLVKGQLVIRKGTSVKGRVISADRFGIQVTSTQTVDGQALRLRAAKGGDGDQSSGRGIFDVVSGLFSLKQDGDAEIAEGTHFAVESAEAKYFRVDDSTLVPIYPAHRIEQASQRKAGSPRLEGFAIIYIYRPKKLVRSIIELPLFRDSINVARIKNGFYLALKLPPGHHRLHTGDPNRGYFVDLEPGYVYYFRAAFETWSSKAELKLEDAERAVPEINKLKFAERGQILDLITVIDLPAPPPKP